MPVVNPTVAFADYRDKYENIRFSREDGIVEMTFHTGGGPFVMSGLAHAEAGDAFFNVGADHENKIVILTGTGDVFCNSWTRDSFDRSTQEGHARINYEGRRILQNLLDVESIVISAINGPSVVHSFPVVADICLCATHATFQDNHVSKGGSPVGDGANIIWQHLLGPTRGKYFLLLGQLLTAQEALALGVVNEVLAPEDLLPRARALALELAQAPHAALRYSRLILNQQLRRLMLDELAFSYGMQMLGQATAVPLPPEKRWG
jgi:enoyl-CoA hydratase/carnithine racemase